MGLSKRALEYTKRHQEARNTGGEQNIGAQTIQVFPQPAVGIVDGEQIEVQGYATVPDMSLCAICSDPRSGVQAPVALTDPAFRMWRTLTPDAVREIALLGNSQK